MKSTTKTLAIRLLLNCENKYRNEQQQLEEQPTGFSDEDVGDIIRLGFARFTKIKKLEAKRALTNK